jgi:hypothetical protein
VSTNQLTARILLQFVALVQLKSRYPLALLVQMLALQFWRHGLVYLIRELQNT